MPMNPVPINQNPINPINPVLGNPILVNPPINPISVNPLTNPPKNPPTNPIPTPIPLNVEKPLVELITITYLELRHLINRHMNLALPTEVFSIWKHVSATIYCD